MFSWRGCDIPITFTDRQYQRTKAKLVSSLNPVPGYVSPPPPSPNLIDVLCFHGLVSLGIDTSILYNWNRTLTFSNKRWTFQREIYIYITSFKLIRTIGRWPISARATNENNIKPPPRLNLITIILALWRGRKLNCKCIAYVSSAIIQREKGNFWRELSVMPTARDGRNKSTVFGQIFLQFLFLFFDSRIRDDNSKKLGRNYLSEDGG